MARTLCTGNYAAGHTLALAGEANRTGRGCCGGAYPITPQTEIIEYLRAFNFTKGRIVPVESEHSAMGVCIGAAISGARAFTASSSNGLAYMTENVFAAGYYRLPIVMIAVNRTLGPPWNIWVDQGDSLALRDAPWLQFYCESHQDLVDTIAVAGERWKVSPRSYETADEMLARARLVIVTTGIESAWFGKLTEMSMSPPPSAPPETRLRSPQPRLAARPRRSATS